MNFFGSIEFVDSFKEDRTTNRCSFELVTDWYATVKEYFTQEVMTHQYDGSEVVIRIYADDSLIQTYSIENPYFE